ncbi:MAG: hypothetical protein ABI386_06880 [Rhodanobacter sp.]
MSKVFANIGLSLDGYMAPDGMNVKNWDRPEYKNWGAKWGAFMDRILKQQYFPENLNTRCERGAWKTACSSRRNRSRAAHAALKLRALFPVSQDSDCRLRSAGSSNATHCRPCSAGVSQPGVFAGALVQA